MLGGGRVHGLGLLIRPLVVRHGGNEVLVLKLSQQLAGVNMTSPFHQKTAHAPARCCIEAGSLAERMAQPKIKTL